MELLPSLSVSQSLSHLVVAGRSLPATSLQEYHSFDRPFLASKSLNPVGSTEFPLPIGVCCGFNTVLESLFVHA
jgi:hypothetical protein